MSLPNTLVGDFTEEVCRGCFLTVTSIFVLVAVVGFFRIALFDIRALLRETRSMSLSSGGASSTERSLLVEDGLRNPGSDATDGNSMGTGTSTGIEDVMFEGSSHRTGVLAQPLLRIPPEKRKVTSNVTLAQAQAAKRQRSSRVLIIILRGVVIFHALCLVVYGYTSVESLCKFGMWRPIWSYRLMFWSGILVFDGLMLIFLRLIRDLLNLSSWIYFVGIIYIAFSYIGFFVSSLVFFETTNQNYLLAFFSFNLANIGIYVVLSTTLIVILFKYCQKHTRFSSQILWLLCRIALVTFGYAVYAVISSILLWLEHTDIFQFARWLSLLLFVALVADVIPCLALVTVFHSSARSTEQEGLQSKSTNSNTKRGSVISTTSGSSAPDHVSPPVSAKQSFSYASYSSSLDAESHLSANSKPSLPHSSSRPSRTSMFDKMYPARK